MAGRGRKRLFTDQQLIELHEQGLSDEVIGEKLLAHFSTVNIHRRRLGLKAHDPRRLFTDQQLIDLHENGLNDKEKAKRLGSSKEVVFDHRRRLGLKPVVRKR